jgi:hypothetical protein
MVLSGALFTAGILLPTPGQTKAVTDTSLFGAPKVFDFSEFPLGDTFQVGGNTVPVGSPVNEDIDLRSTNLDYQGGSVIGNQTNALLRSNGQWNPSPPASATYRILSYAALNGPDPYSLEFTFNSGPVLAVGSFMNYIPKDPSRGVDYGDALIEAVGAGGTVLETYNVTQRDPISTPVAWNGGAFRGIVRETPDIFAFRVRGSFAILTDITFSRQLADVPGPLPALGAAAAFGWSRRLRRRVAASAPATPAR